MNDRAHKFYKRFRTDADGASAIEFAIVAPIFLMLVFGIIFYGYYFTSLNMVNHIAYEAARATVSGLTDDERSALAHARADELVSAFGGFLDPSSLQVDAQPAGSGVYSVSVHYHVGGLDLLGASSLLPHPSTDQTVTVHISHGGY